MDSEGLAGCVRGRKRYQINIQNDSTIPKPTENLCRIYIRKNDAKNIENHQNGDQKGS